MQRQPTDYLSGRVVFSPPSPTPSNILGPTPTDRRHHVRTGITIGRSLCLCVPELFRAVRAVLTTRR
jgi:hypothetical protein